MSGAVFGWGLNNNGQCSVGYVGSAPGKIGAIKSPKLGQFITGIQEIASGAQFAVVLLPTKEIRTFGGGKENGTLGTGEFINTPEAQNPGLTNIKQIACPGPSGFAMALNTAGKVFTWGGNGYGTIGSGISGEYVKKTIPVSEESKFPYCYPTPYEITTLPKIEYVACGTGNAGAISEAGALYLWGENCSGQLGDGTHQLPGSSAHEKSSPQLVGGGLPAITKVAMAGLTTQNEKSHVLALTTLGKLWSWGGNLYGQLGLGNEVLKKWTPQEATFTHGTIIGVWAGVGCSFVLTEANELWTVGWNKGLQLGLEGVPNNEKVLTWTKVLPNTAFPTVKVANFNISYTKFTKGLDEGGGVAHAIDTSGKVYGWGDNWFYAIDEEGRTGHEKVETPKLMPSLESVEQVSAGEASVLAISSPIQLPATGGSILKSGVFKK